MRVAIGAPFNDGNGEYSGHVRVYEYDGSSWSQLGDDIDGENPCDQSGYSVSFSSDGTRVAIGANENDGGHDENNGNGGFSGHVRVYEFVGSNWSQLGEDIDGENPDDYSGFSVSLSEDGSRIAIGATLNDGNGVDSGHVRVYEFNGTGWIHLGQDIDGENSNDWSGWSVSLSASGSRLAIGAVNNDDNGERSGHVRVYEYNGSTWSQLGGGIDGERENHYSGRSVSISANGERVADGAGHVRVYEWPGSSKEVSLTHETPRIRFDYS